MTHAEGFKDQGSYKPCNLVAGEYPRIERIVTIAAGADLTKGAVLGRITASGKFALSASASSDGTELPDAILAEHALELGAGHTLDSIRIPLRAKSIFLAKNQSA